jgi:hypothetical protein
MNHRSKNRGHRIFCATLALVSLLSAQAKENPPRFEDYPVKVEKVEKPAKPILVTKRDHVYRTVIRQGAAQGVNFAGHYALVQWGCGTGCAMFTVVDAKTGKVYDPSANAIADDASYEFPDDHLQFKANSTLLIVAGCPDDKDCGIYYYEFSKDRFALLQKAPAKRREAGR